MALSATEEKGRATFKKFSRGLKTGDWSGFTDLLTDDFTFYFPQGNWHGEHRGKAKALEFFPYVTSVFPGGITVVSLDRVHVSGDTAMLEFKDEGTMALSGATYLLWTSWDAVFISYRIQNNCSVRQGNCSVKGRGKP